MAESAALLPTLLPPNSTDFERACEQVSAACWDRLDVDILGRSKDPWACPEHLLGFLAFERSVDVWDDSWPLDLKRWVIARWPHLQRQKGTLAGLRSFAALAGGNVLKTVVPPGKTFLSPAFSAAERRTYLARFQQLRTYPFVARARARFGCFAGAGADGLARTFLGTAYPTDLVARSRYRRDVKLFEPRDGSLTDLATRHIVRSARDTRTAVEYEEVALPPAPSVAIHLGGRPQARRFLLRGNAARRLVSLRVERSYSHVPGRQQYTTVSPGLAPISVEPELVADRGARLAGQLFPRRHGGFLAHKHLPPSSAWQRLYERLYLFDPARTPDARPRGTHLGNTRLGMPPHHAEALVAIRGKRPLRAASRFVDGFLVAADRAPLEKVRTAMNASRRLSDRINLGTRTRRALRAGDPILASSTTIGGIVAV